MTQTQKITSENIHAKMLAIREKRNAQVAECTYTTPENIIETARQEPEFINHHLQLDDIRHTTQINDPVNAKIVDIIKSRLENNGVFSICEYGVEFLAYYHRGIVRWQIQCGDGYTESAQGETNEYHIQKLADAILCIKITNYSLNLWLDMCETFVGEDIAEQMFIGRGRQLEEEQS